MIANFLKLIIARIGPTDSKGAVTRSESKISTIRRASTIVEDEEFWRQIPNPAAVGWRGTAAWALRSVLHAALFYTIPDSRKKPNLFVLSFLASIAWLAFFSYIMVWMVSLIGFTFAIPDSIMGITFLAAGTSVPDAYASLHVAKQGHGDMAVSNVSFHQNSITNTIKFNGILYYSSLSEAMCLIFSWDWLCPGSSSLSYIQVSPSSMKTTSCLILLT